MIIYSANYYIKSFYISTKTIISNWTEIIFRRAINGVKFLTSVTVIGILMTTSVH